MPICINDRRGQSWVEKDELNMLQHSVTNSRRIYPRFQGPCFITEALLFRCAELDDAYGIAKATMPSNTHMFCQKMDCLKGIESYSRKAPPRIAT